MKDLIKKYREQTGLTQEQLAGMLSVSPQAVSNYEAGFRTPDWDMVKAIKRALGIPSSEILEEAGTNMENNKPLFTEKDFIRFCAAWEHDDGMYDIDPSMIEKQNGAITYTVFREQPYQFNLQNGHILWNHPNWDADFVNSFERVLGDLRDKKLYGEPQKFKVSYESDEGDNVSRTVLGFDSDAENDVFMLASIEACIKGESTIAVCSDFSYKAI